MGMTKNEDLERKTSFRRCIIGEWIELHQSLFYIQMWMDRQKHMHLLTSINYFYSHALCTRPIQQIQIQNTLWLPETHMTHVIHNAKCSTHASWKNPPC